MVLVAMAMALAGGAGRERDLRQEGAVEAGPYRIEIQFMRRRE